MLVRLQNRHVHENVDDLLGPRNCITFNGRQGFIALSEEDLQPPFTAEYWVYRAPLHMDTYDKVQRTLGLYEQMQLTDHTFKDLKQRCEVLEHDVKSSNEAYALSKSDEDEALKEKKTDQLILAAEETQKAQIEDAVAKVSGWGACCQAFDGPLNGSLPNHDPNLDPNPNMNPYLNPNPNYNPQPRLNQPSP